MPVLVQTRPVSRPLRLLVAEDEAVIALGLKQVLLSAGYEVCAIVATARDAVEAAGRMHPDLVLMDIMLRDGDGVDAACTIWASYRIRSLFMSALDATSLHDRAAAAYPLGFLTKPYRCEDLLSRLEQAARVRVGA